MVHGLHLQVPKPRSGACSGCYKVRVCGVPASPGEREARCYDATQMEIQERTESLVSLTPAAAAKIRDLMATEEDVSVLRVAIEGGGCSGFQYGLGFDRGAQEGDHEFECEGVSVVVDPFSAPYLMGARVDYLETIQESGFKIENPNAVSSCGCGHSFQVAEGEAPEDAAGCGSGCAH
jgi:iron-sulfur cluster assembly accessory protein